MNAIQISGVGKSYATVEGPARRVLHDVSLTIKYGEIHTFFGPNGCGKSTLLAISGQLLSPDSGTVEIRTDHGTQSRIGMLWQDYRSSLLPWMDGIENIAFPLRLRGVTETMRRERVDAMIREYPSRFPLNVPCYRLSGGGQQWVCLLRNAVAEPDVQLLDEPFSAIDFLERWSLLLEFERLWLKRPVPTAFVSHDVDEALLAADHLHLMRYAMNGEPSIMHSVAVGLPRPRTREMLTGEKHVRNRAVVLDLMNSLRESVAEQTVPFRSRSEATPPLPGP